MELLFLALFAASLIACVVTGASVVFALIFGYILFFSYGLIHGKSVKEMLRFSRNGIFTVKNVLLTLLLISMLTQRSGVPVVPLPISYIMHLPSVLLP